MVQQLSLFGTIPLAQHKLLLDSLSTYTGSSPVHYETLTVLAQPSTILKFEPNSKTTQYEQHRLQLKTSYTSTNELKDYKDWIIHAADIPSSGKRKISIQAILESYINLSKAQTIESTMNSLGYHLQTSYVTKGDRFFAGNVVIEVFQVFIGLDGNGLGELKLLENQFLLVKAYINVEKVSAVDHLNRSGQELLNIKSDLTGLIELEIPDRNSMDSRIGLTK